MKIVGIERFPISLPQPGNDTSNLKPPRLQTIIVRLRTTSGLTGLGEAPVTPAEDCTLSSLIDWLSRYEVAISGTDATNINVLHQTLDQVGGQNSPGCQIARAAVDMAVHDIIGKARGRPVHEILGGSYRDRMQAKARISSAVTTDIGAAARSLVGAGYKALTVELADDVLGPTQSIDRLQRMCESLRAVLEATGTEISIDADAGQSLGNPALVSRMFEQLFSKRFYPNLALVQPLSKWDLLGHAALREKLPVSLVLTEGVVSAEAVMQIERIGAADRIGLSLERVGGFSNAMAVADICEAAALGITPTISSYTGIGASALCHLAAVLHDPYPIEFRQYGSVHREPAIGGPVVHRGEFFVGSKPGLGIELDEESILDLRIC